MALSKWRLVWGGGERYDVGDTALNVRSISYRSTAGTDISGTLCWTLRHLIPLTINHDYSYPGLTLNMIAF